MTPTILGLNVLWFGLMFLGSRFNPNLEHLVDFGADFGPCTLNGQWIRLVSSTFVHIGVLHLAVNMWCLWSLGVLTERMFGHWTFLMLYALSGIGGSIISLLWNPTVVSAGVSGAIFGVAGGLVAFLYFERIQVAEGTRCW